MKIQSLKLAATVLDSSKYPNTPWREIAVAGRSNVGKSSLLNTLLGRKNFARISKEPGKTRTVNFILINDRFYLVDLPGYGYAKVSAEMRKKWRNIIYEYFEKRTALGGVIHLVDSRHPPTRDDLGMLQHLVDAGRPFLVALTKADKIGSSKRAHVMKEFKSHFGDLSVGLYADDAMNPEICDVPVVFFSARTGEGKDQIWRWIKGCI